MPLSVRKFPFGAGGGYGAKVRGYNPIAYWKMNETAGTNADNAESTAARDGTYTGVTLNSSTGPDGQPAGLWDGANDYCDIYSASLNSVFGGGEGTLSLWAKVSAAGVWNDGTQRRLAILYADGNNFVLLEKTAVLNQLLFNIKLGGVVETDSTITPAGNANWFHLALTWSKIADKVRFFYNGSQDAPTQDALGIWAGNLDNTRTLVGASTQVPGLVWDGYLAHVAIYATPLTPAQIADLAVI